MKLAKGRKYHVAGLVHTGWTGESRYHLDDYFEDGVYLGPGVDGVEPLFADDDTASDVGFGRVGGTRSADK